MKSKGFLFNTHIMAKDPAVLFFISDWLTSTAEMDADVRGWYLNLILHQYDKKDLPNDVEKLAVLANVKFSEYERFKQVFEQVFKQKFNINLNNRLENDKAKTILQGRTNFKDKRSNAGKYSYLKKFAATHFKLKVKEFNYIKEHINFDEFDLKNEQVFKQVIEHLFELYRNENENENKVKDEIKIRDNVFLKKEEKEKLISEYGEKDFEWIINKLSNYKLASGKKYKSDYGAINSWVIKELLKFKSEPDTNLTAEQKLNKALGI